jgi:hypothetical protein
MKWSILLEFQLQYVHSAQTKRGGTDLTLHEFQIADVASIIVSKKQDMDLKPSVSPAKFCISLDVPKFHYYQSTFGKLDQGLCTASEALRWIDAVDRRHDQIGTVLENSIRHEIHRRGISSVICRVNTSSSSKLLGLSIRESLKQGNCSSLGDLLHELNSNEDEEWLTFFGLLKRSEIPKDHRGLGYLFYVFEVVRKALARIPSAGDSPSPRLMISFDDVAEFRIYSEAQKYLKRIRNAKLGNASLMEIYPCRRIFINGNRKAGLYIDDPSPEHALLVEDSISDAVALQRRLEPIKVVEKLFGQECARSLQGFFKDVCL